MKNKIETNAETNMKRKVVKRIVERCLSEGKRAKTIAAELKIAGYKVFAASFCMCEGIVFFDTHAGLQIRVIA